MAGALLYTLIYNNITCLDSCKERESSLGERPDVVAPGVAIRAPQESLHH